MILEGTLWPNLSKARLAVVTSCGAVALGISLTMVSAQAGSTDEGQGPPVTTRPALPAVRAEGMPAPDPIAGVGGTPVWGMPITGTPIGLQVRNPNVSDGMPAMLTPNPLSQPGPHDDDVRKLLRDRYRAALQVLQGEFQRSLTDPIPVNMANIGVAARTLLERELALAGPSDLAIYERYVQLTTLLDHRAEGLLKAKLISLEDSRAVHERRLDAENKLRECREKSSTVLEDQRQPAGRITEAASLALSDLLTSPLEPNVGEHDVHRQLKQRYNWALKSLQLQYSAECRLCHSKEKKATRVGEKTGFGELRIDKPSWHPNLTSSAGSEHIATNVQGLQIRVRIAEAEVAAARAVAQQGEAELKRALAKLKYRQTRLDRVESARKLNGVSQSEVEDATHARDDAASSVEAARASIAATQAQGAIKVAQLEQVQLELKQAKAAGE